jgi:hypothetical protein
MVLVIAVVVIGVGLAALLVWGTRGTPNDDEGGGTLAYLGAPPLMDESDRGVVGPDDEDIEEANRSSDF